MRHGGTHEALRQRVVLCLIDLADLSLRVKEVRILFTGNQEILHRCNGILFCHVGHAPHEIGSRVVGIDFQCVVNIAERQVVVLLQHVEFGQFDHRACIVWIHVECFVQRSGDIGIVAEKIIDVGQQQKGVHIVGFQSNSAIDVHHGRAHLFPLEVKLSSFEIEVGTLIILGNGVAQEAEWIHYGTHCFNLLVFAIVIGFGCVVAGRQ